MELRNPIHALLHEWHRPDILVSGRESQNNALAPSMNQYSHLSHSLLSVMPPPGTTRAILRKAGLQIREEVAPSSSKKMVLSQSTKEFSHRYFNAATRNVTSKDQLSGIYDAFVSSYKALIEENTELVGNPDDPATLIGPLVDESQFNRVLGFMDRGSSQGFVAPTVFLDVPEDAEIMPCAKRFLAQSRSSIRIFTKDITRAMRFSAELDSGMVGINAVSTVFWQAPFGGTKESGIGRENGVHAIRSFTEPKTVFVNMNA
ncbi:hypothetical protein CEP52_005362 [Fusarium oligoseptatum]|uniref:aldehyde dehydrogenase (NAD(+)) n=1 Tax=Fusarium oligoseptatum TaxID=2604345 RepID=A0A428TYW9_9HYPO|nr:hypothetical protein CEP52_005362 [Fusarium oligoseptatum]